MAKRNLSPNFLQKFNFFQNKDNVRGELLVNKTKKFTTNDGNFLVCDDRLINHLVIHHIAADSFDEAIKTLKECQVSSHYIIDQSGKIFLLVEEKDIAYHAGVSFWGGQDGLNATSIGIEFYNPKPFEIPFSKKQIDSGIQLCLKLVNQYKIKPQNVVGHCDIAYFPDNEENRTKKIVGFLGRKDDPSFLFPWNEFCKLGITKPFEPETIDLLKEIDFKQIKIFPDLKIRKLKNKLSDFGYKIDNIEEDIIDSQFLTVIKTAKSRLGIS